MTATGTIPYAHNAPTAAKHFMFLILVCSQLDNPHQTNASRLITFTPPLAVGQKDKEGVAGTRGVGIGFGGSVPRNGGNVQGSLLDSELDIERDNDFITFDDVWSPGEEIYSTIPSLVGDHERGK